MRRLILPSGVFVVALAAGFWITLNAIPGVIMSKAMTRIAAATGDAGTPRHAPRLREDNQTIVRASPDILYSVCIVDLSQGPRRITAPWPADGNYASVSFYDARTNNFAVVSDRDAGTRETAITLTRDAGTTAPDSIVAPTDRSLVLYRRVIDAETDMAAAETGRRGFTCARLSGQ